MSSQLRRSRSLVLGALAPLTLAAQDARPSLAEPSMAPSGEIAFAAGGDLWSVPRGGGEARLLVAHPATESRPRWSPDGTQLAFVSTRTGNGDIYVLVLATGELRRVTFDDAADALDGWSPDGEWLYFSSSARDVAGMNDVLRVRASGGTPTVVAGDRYASEYFAAAAPDGKRLAIAARGIVSGQWWRHGHSHIDESELWLVTMGATPAYTRLGEARGAKDAWPMWSPDGATVYYMSDRGGHENLWARPVAGGEARRLTSFTDGRVLWPQLAPDGRTIVFERDFRIWAHDVASGRTASVPITLRGAASGRGVERVTLSSGWNEVLVSPDGKKLALVARGEVWVAGARDAGEARRLTRTVAPEAFVAWTRDSRALVFVEQRTAGSPVVRLDVASGTRTVLAQGGDHAHVTVSPDGRRVAFTRDGATLHVVGTDGTGERLLARGTFGRAPFVGGLALAWSPDSRWIAYLSQGTRGFTHAHVVPAAGGAEARQVSFLASSTSYALHWTPDGGALLFLTRQRTEPARLVRVDLVPRTPRYRETLLDELFTTTVPGRRDSLPRRDSTRLPERRDSATVARDTAQRRDSVRVAGTRVVFEGIRERAVLLEPGIDVADIALSPDGKTLALVSAGAGQPNLYTWSLDELAREPAVPRQVTTTPGNKDDVQWSPDGRELWFTDGGRIAAVTVETRAVRPVAVTAELEVDFHAEKVAVFEQAWRWQQVAFYDPAMHGADWDAVRTRFAPQVAGAQTPDELRRLLQLMVGELNASHLGVNGSSAPPAVPVGRLGLDLDPAALERDGTARVAAVIANGPAAITGAIRAGDRIVSVNGTTLTRTTNLDSLLAGTVGRRVELSVQGAAGPARTVVLRAVPLGTEKELRYRQWVEERRAYVAKASNGRLGYVHMVDMSADALNQLHLDLDAENFARDGVVIDVRNNNGGFVNGYALDVFARQGYLTLTQRGRNPAPARSSLGQRALEKPTVLVTNQHSLSDAEDFTEGYRALGLGRVVGEPTAGWIIYTSNLPLLDGQSVMRIPSTRVQGADGRDMERVPRPVDVPVTRPIGESYTGRDVQLDEAVKVLLARLAASK
jgi:Tol biopolymer transport system component/C-terminal processing protease CtpA/Prc